jgi:hypothetical protein
MSNTYAKAKATGLFFNGTNFGAKNTAEALALRPGTEAKDFQFSWACEVEIVIADAPVAAVEIPATEIAFNYEIPAALDKATAATFRGPTFWAKLEITRLNETEGSSYRPPFAVRILMIRDGSTFNGGRSGYCSTTTSLKRWISKNCRELSKAYNGTAK